MGGGRVHSVGGVALEADELSRGAAWPPRKTSKLGDLARPRACARKAYLAWPVRSDLCGRQPDTTGVDACRTSARAPPA
jgi:hypothetical protein